MGELVMTFRSEDEFTHQEFNGLRNNVDAGEFELGDLEVALNVEVNDSKVIQRRKGYGTAAVAGSYHSLWAGAGVCLAVTGTSLVQISPSYATTTLRTGLASGRRMSYEAIGGRAYYSNGVDTGVIENGASRTWGIAVPSAISATAISGTLRAGRYQFALTYLRSDGQESGASLAGVLELTAAGGLRFTNLPVSTDTGVTTKALYVSKCNGETLFRRAVLLNATTNVDVTDDGDSTLALLTQHLNPAPAGDVISSYNGRTLSAKGSAIYPSEPYAYELFDLRNAINLESTVGIVAPVSGGVFVGTEDQIVFLKGEDVGSLSYEIRAEYGVIPGTLARAQADTIGDGSQSGLAWLWASKQGLCAAFDGGGFKNLTMDRFAYPVTERGTGVVRRHRGMNQYLAVLEGASTAGNAHG